MFIQLTRARFLGAQTHVRFASSRVPIPSHSIYVSKSTDPYFNLSLEDWLLQHKAKDEPLLLLYRNGPCVVIGRNQNPWKEVNIPESRRTGIPVIRRRSGGGTVYHDLGNTNYSIHIPRTLFDRSKTGQLVLRAVRSLGIDATMNDRNDICVNGEKICAASCAAYKIVKDRAYHHGTMLISTDLSTLGKLLRSGKDTMETRGVASVRSPVCNLQQHSARIDHDRFVNAMVNAFRQHYKVDWQIHEVRDSDGTRDIEHIKSGVKELKTWNWAFGQTPEFTYKLERVFRWGIVKADILSKHGVILSCSLQSSPNADVTFEEALAQLGRDLKEQRFGDVDGWEGNALLVSANERLLEVWKWLKSEMDVEESAFTLHS